MELLLNKRVVSGDEDHITLDDGSILDTNTVIWAAGVKGVTIPGLEAGLNERASRFMVDRTNAIHGFNDIHVLGDMALMEEPAYPKGIRRWPPWRFSKRRHLAKISFAARKGRSPCRSAIGTGSMAVIGRRKAVVDIGQWNFGGTVAWLLWMLVRGAARGLPEPRRGALQLGLEIPELAQHHPPIVRPYVRKGTAVARPFVAVSRAGAPACFRALPMDRRLFILWFTIFIDLIGFTLFVPVVPISPRPWAQARVW
ncbi:MAG: hypothetical protein IPF41_08280 [Flavobacteriales bacterium]|nr:hypothetical protein [Flavobacteriales bacterium]